MNMLNSPTLTDRLVRSPARSVTRFRRRGRISSRGGFSLLEFSVTSLVVGILMIGLSSSIHLVTRAARLSEGPASRTTEAARCIEEVIADIRMAGIFKERSENRVTFTVPDRDGDAAADEISFHWDRNGDGKLWKTTRMSDSDDQPEPRVMLDAVNGFGLRYQTRRWGPPPPAEEIESEERLLIAHDDFPQASGNRLLMVVADAGAPTNQETARVALVEGWGFAVESISDHASRSDFEAALARNDVVYVSETALSDEVGDKLKATKLGVVNEEPFLVDEFGLSNGTGSSNADTLLDETVGTHFLTYGWLPDEPATLYSSGQPARNLHPDAEQRAPDLEVLATRDGQPALAVMPVDGELFRPESNKGKRFGETEVLSQQTGSWDFADRYVANRWTLPHTAECFSLTAYLTIPGGRRVRFGIYADDNGQPGALVAETERYRASWSQSRWVTIDFDSPVILEPGDYWLTVGMEPGVQLQYEPAGGLARWADTGRDPTKGMMDPWTGTYGPTDNRHRYSLYATYDIVERAAGRRVQLPWGTDSLTVAALTEQGQALLRRSLQWAADTTPADEGSSWQVTSSHWAGQYFMPELPTNVTGWKLTRLFCRLRRDPGSSASHVGFGLAHSDLQQLPSSFTIQEAERIDMGATDEERFRWFEIPIDATGDLRPDRGICFYVQSSSNGTKILSQFDSGSPDTPGTSMCQSWNGGSNWSSSDDQHDMRFYAYGKFLTAGEPQW